MGMMNMVLLDVASDVSTIKITTTELKETVDVIVTKWGYVKLVT
jgi:hypothetical protein